MTQGVLCYNFFMSNDQQIKKNIQAAMNQIDTFMKSDTMQAAKKATAETIQSVSNSIANSLNPPKPRPSYASRKAKKMKKKATDKRNLGIFLTGLGVLITLTDDMMTGIAFMIIGGVMWHIQRQKLKQMDRFSLYSQVFQSKTSVSIEELSQTVNEDSNTVADDIRQMITNELLEHAYFDATKQTIYSSYSAYQQATLPPTPKEQEAKTTSTYPEEIQAFIQSMVDYRNQIHTLSSQIHDEDIKHECKRMDLILSNIQEYVSKNFDALSKTNRIMKYYVPTALKLLVNYKDLETGHIQLDASDTSIQDIERALNQLNEGFLTIYTDMCQDTSIDIHADISVLQSMLQQDGLKEKEKILK